MFPKAPFSVRYFLRTTAYMLTVHIAIPWSVRLSHRWISQKRLKLGSCNFHLLTVAPFLYNPSSFCAVSFIQKF